MFFNLRSPIVSFSLLTCFLFLSHSFLLSLARRYKEVINVSPKLVLILMEFAGGGDLMNKIDKEKLYYRKIPEDQALKWMAQALEALAYIHRSSRKKSFSVTIEKDSHVLAGEHCVGGICVCLRSCSFFSFNRF